MNIVINNNEKAEIFVELFQYLIIYIYYFNIFRNKNFTSRYGFMSN